MEGGGHATCWRSVGSCLLPRQVLKLRKYSVPGGTESFPSSLKSVAQGVARQHKTTHQSCLGIGEKSLIEHQQIILVETLRVPRHRNLPQWAQEKGRFLPRIQRLGGITGEVRSQALVEMESAGPANAGLHASVHQPPPHLIGQPRPGTVPVDLEGLQGPKSTGSDGRVTLTCDGDIWQSFQTSFQAGMAVSGGR